jgi:hypothetical protein
MQLLEYRVRWLSGAFLVKALRTTRPNNPVGAEKRSYRSNRETSERVQNGSFERSKPRRMLCSNK